MKVMLCRHEIDFYTLYRLIVFVIFVIEDQWNLYNFIGEV